MEEPLYSVLIPTHNRAEVLGLAIASVLQQSEQNFEILVVGDGCTDDSASVVAEFGDDRIRWFDLPKGPGFGYDNRNVALREARGKLVAFLGHDNLMFPDHLQRLANPFANQQVMLAYSRPLWIRDDGVILPFYVNLNTQPARNSFMSERNVLPASVMVYRRSVHDLIGFWPEEILESGDWEFWKRILRAHPDGLRVIRVPTCLHFRAIWRNPAAWAPPSARYLSYMRDNSRSFPPALDLKLLPDGGLPQVQVARRLAQESMALVNAIRNGVEILADVLAWNATLDQNVM